MKSKIEQYKAELADLMETKNDPNTPKDIKNAIEPAIEKVKKMIKDEESKPSESKAKPAEKKVAEKKPAKAEKKSAPAKKSGSALERCKEIIAKYRDKKKADVKRVEKRRKAGKPAELTPAETINKAAKSVKAKVVEMDKSLKVSEETSIINGIISSAVSAMAGIKDVHRKKMFIGKIIEGLRKLEKNLGMKRAEDGMYLHEIDENFKDDNAEMLRLNVVEIEHHVSEIKEALKSGVEVEGWVLSRSVRAKTDMSDITHYLDSSLKADSMADGGEVQKINMGNGVFMDLEDAIKMYEDKIKSQGRIVNERDEDMLKQLKRMRNNYADGGYMAKGGDIQPNYRIGDVIGPVDGQFKYLVVDFVGYKTLLLDEQYNTSTERTSVYANKIENRTWKVFDGGMNAQKRFAREQQMMENGGYMAKGGETKIYEISLKPKNGKAMFSSSIRAKSKEDAIKLYKEKSAKYNDDSYEIVDVHETTRRRLEDGGVNYPTDLKVGSIIKGVGFPMLKGIDGDKYYKVVELDDYSATFVLTDSKGKRTGSKKVRHYLSSIDGKIRTASRGDNNGIEVIKYEDGGYMAKGGETKKAKWIQTTSAKNVEDDEGYWENYEYATSKELMPSEGRYRGYKWVLTTNEAEPEGFWQKIGGKYEDGGYMAKGGYIIKRKDDDEYVTYDDSRTSFRGGYSITHNESSARIFKSKKDAQDEINKNNLELHLMSELEVVKMANGGYMAKGGNIEYKASDYEYIGTPSSQRYEFKNKKDGTILNLQSFWFNRVGDVWEMTPEEALNKHFEDIEKEIKRNERMLKNINPKYWEKVRSKAFKTLNEAEKKVIDYMYRLGYSAKNFNIEKIGEGYVITYDSYVENDNNVSNGDMAKRGRLLSAINRDRAYRSDEEWEKGYKRKARPKNPKYNSSYALGGQAPVKKYPSLSNNTTHLIN